MSSNDPLAQRLAAPGPNSRPTSSDRALAWLRRLRLELSARRRRRLHAVTDDVALGPRADCRTGPPAGAARSPRGRAALLASTAIAATVALLGAAPDDPPALDATLPPVRALVERYAVDRALLQRSLDVPLSAAGDQRFQAFHREMLAALEATPFEALPRDQQIDHILMRNEAERALERLEAERRRRSEIVDLVPFADTIVALDEARRRFEPVDGEAAAAALAKLARDIAAARDSATTRLETPADGDEQAAAPPWPRHVAARAARAVDQLRAALAGWHAFYAGYDPLFTWWAAAPFGQADQALVEHAAFLRERLAGMAPGDADAIVGDPIGREALLAELGREFVAYSPEELIALAEREYAWCLERMLEAARELGCGDDWKAALEKVKAMHVAPGEQPALIHRLAVEAIEFIESRGLITLPELSKKGWRMEMMSPERQRVNPYFLGGESIIVSFPTSGMSHDEKLMSLRSNNEHFCRAVVHHELIPGHHLQGFMNARHRAHRRLFDTPFWIEGWAVWWEMHLWDLGFPRSPADRVGMLFWRMHRCVRVVFSLQFHLGQIDSDEAIAMLVERVGHEPAAAEAEVRRSLSGAYGPLYQAAYLLGALQFRALHAELVDGGAMAEREFNDAVLRLGPIPVELVRASLVDEPLDRAQGPRWRFAGEPATW